MQENLASNARLAPDTATASHWVERARTRVSHKRGVGRTAPDGARQPRRRSGLPKEQRRLHSPWRSESRGQEDARSSSRASHHADRRPSRSGLRFPRH